MVKIYVVDEGKNKNDLNEAINSFFEDACNTFFFWKEKGTGDHEKYRDSYFDIEWNEYI